MRGRTKPREEKKDEREASACGLFLLDLSRAPPYLGTGTGRSGPPSPSPSRCGRRRAAVAAAVARRRRKQQQRGRRGGLLRRPWAWEAATPMTLRQLPAPKREPRRSASKPSLVSLSWGRRCLPRLQEGATAASCPRREREREREDEKRERSGVCLFRRIVSRTARLFFSPSSSPLAPNGRRQRCDRGQFLALQLVVPLFSCSRVALQKTPKRNRLSLT